MRGRLAEGSRLSGFTMNDFQRRVRAAVYARFLDHGMAPSTAQLAGECGVTRKEIADALKALADEHCLVLRRDTGEVWMAHPFSAIETDCVVRVGNRRWFANCAWDALAILAVLGDGTFDAHVLPPRRRCNSPHATGRSRARASSTSSCRRASFGTTSGTREATSAPSGRRAIRRVPACERPAVGGRPVAADCIRPRRRVVQESVRRGLDA